MIQRLCWTVSFSDSREFKRGRVQRAVADELGMIRTPMQTHNISENGRSYMVRLVRYHLVTVTA
jgi:hypothetical protein